RHPAARVGGPPAGIAPDINEPEGARLASPGVAVRPLFPGAARNHGADGADRADLGALGRGGWRWVFSLRPAPEAGRDRGGGAGRRRPTGPDRTFGTPDAPEPSHGGFNQGRPGASPVLTRPARGLVAAAAPRGRGHSG